MAEFPIELWHLIFDHLQLVDLSPCARVSKTFYVAVKSYRIREIAFTRRIYKWFHFATSTIDHKHRLHYSLASILRRSSFDFDYLKRLKIGRRSAIDLNVINRFVHLEELDIDLKNYENEKSRTLSLANLKVLYLFMSDHLPYLELNTPQLEKLHTFSLKKLEFIHPESVQCIHTFFHDGKLSMFRNLEYLTLTDSYNKLNFSSAHVFREFDEFSVTVLKKLKEIDFNYHYNYGAMNMSNFKKMVANLLALERLDLKVFWQNVQVTDPTLLTEYERSIENIRSILVFQLRHYKKLKDKIDFFWSYHFNISIRMLSEAGFNARSEEFLSKLLAKFSFRKLLMITGQVEEQELLFKLIARSPSLLSLNFSNSGLGQSFFDRVADTIQLNVIPLQILGIRNSIILNFEFVLRLRDLLWFVTDQQLPAKLIPKLFELPMLAEIEFSLGQGIERIGRVSASRFLLNEKPLSRQELSEYFGIKSDSIECGLM